MQVEPFKRFRPAAPTPHHCIPRLAQHQAKLLAKPSYQIIEIYNLFFSSSSCPPRTTNHITRPTLSILFFTSSARHCDLRISSQYVPRTGSWPLLSLPHSPPSPSASSSLKLVSQLRPLTRPRDPIAISTHTTASHPSPRCGLSLLSPPDTSCPLSLLINIPLAAARALRDRKSRATPLVGQYSRAHYLPHVSHYTPARGLLVLWQHPRFTPLLPTVRSCPTSFCY